LIRVFSLIFVQDIPFTHGVILVVSGLTMLSGVLGAAAQQEFRRVLSFHIVSQIGYMIMGLALFTPLALAGSVFYLIHHIIVKTNLFLVSGLTHRLRGTFELDRLGSLWRSHPWSGVLFLIPALSLAGIPPLSGFWAKFVLVRAGLEAESYVIVATALVVSLLTLYSMTKIWGEAFWKDAPEGAAGPVATAVRTPVSLVAPIVVLAVITVAIGLVGGPVFELSRRAAEQLLDRGQYIHAVLGVRP
jgi:multicomponent Na+:H+ antiporter subunit D